MKGGIFTSNFEVFCSYSEMVAVDSLIENPRNPNKHPKKQIELLAKIIKNQGWRSPIVVSNRSGFIVKGHGRLQAAKLINCAEVPVDFQDYENEAAEYADLIADNKIAELAELDNESLKELLQEISTFDIDIELTGFDIDSLGNILAVQNEIIEDNFDLDNALNDVKEPISKLGDVWLLGKHRLLCGDSTSFNDFEKLMNGIMADMVFTDPPYNVNYEGKANNKRDKILNDNMNSESFYNFLYDVYVNYFSFLKPGSPLYVCHAEIEAVNFRKALIDAGFYSKECIIWIKNAFVLGRQDYHWQHEPILYVLKL